MRYSLTDYSISAARKGWGQGWPTCTAKTQTAVITAPISGVKVVVHKRIARNAFLLIAETERRGYLLRGGQTWGGNCRAIAGTDVSSNHAWWIAVDINSLANPYVKKGLRVTDFPAWMPLLWNAFGWAWGGAYGDSMHLEFMGSPEDADDMTALAEARLAPGLGGTAAGGLINLSEEDDMSTEAERLLARIADTLQVRNDDPVKPIVLRIWGHQSKSAEAERRNGGIPRAMDDLVTDVYHATDGVATTVNWLVQHSDQDPHELATELAPLLKSQALLLPTTTIEQLVQDLANEQDRRARDGDPATGPVS